MTHKSDAFILERTACPTYNLESDVPKKEQMFSLLLHIYVPPGDKAVTEAAVKRWVAAQLKECPFGTVTLGDCVEFRDQMVEDVKRNREARKK